MSSFNYTVDTQPMADEMRSVSHHVNATTTAVVAMKAAVIDAEDKAANHICNNVNRGFYSLIRSQISQKLAKLQSEIDSLIMQLSQQKNALINIKNRMERDYNMISRRYAKLFNGLNTNLKKRIFELDRPTINFAYKEIDKITNRVIYLTAVVPITQIESITISQRIISSNVKQKGNNAINSMKSFIHEMNMQKKLTNEILINDNSVASDKTIYLPVAICEFNMDKSDNKNISVIVPEAELNSAAKLAMKNAAYKEFSDMKWKQSSVSSKEILSEFSNLVSYSEKPERIKKMALNLFQSNNFQII